MQELAEFNNGFIRSDLIKVFPCAYRGKFTKPDGTEINVDSEARINTENNFRKLKGIIDEDKNSYIYKKDTPNKTYYCIVNGYYFEIGPLTNDLDNTHKVLNIKLARYNTGNDTAAQGALDGTYVLAKYDELSAPIQVLDKDGYFYGMKFTGTAESEAYSLDTKDDKYLFPVRYSKVESVKVGTAITGDLIKGTGNHSILQLSDATIENSASGTNSIALGTGTKATEENMLAIGKYNSSKPEDIFVIGNGIDNCSPKNIVSVNKQRIDINNAPIHIYSPQAGTTSGIHIYNSSNKDMISLSAAGSIEINPTGATYNKISLNSTTGCIQANYLSIHGDPITNFITVDGKTGKINTCDLNVRNAATITTANIPTLSSSTATITNLKATTGTIANLTSTNATITTGKITNLNVSNATASILFATTGGITNLNATNASITTIVGDLTAKGTNNKIWNKLSIMAGTNTKLVEINDTLDQKLRVNGDANISGALGVVSIQAAGHIKTDMGNIQAITGNVIAGGNIQAITGNVIAGGNITAGGYLKATEDIIGLNFAATLSITSEQGNFVSNSDTGYLGLRADSKTYKIRPLFQHIVKLKVGGEISATFTMLTPKSTIELTDAYDYLQSISDGVNIRGVPATGRYISSGVIYNIVGIGATSDRKYNYIYINGQGAETVKSYKETSIDFSAKSVPVYDTI